MTMISKKKVVMLILVGVMTVIFRISIGELKGNYSETCVKRPLSKRQKIGFQD